MTTKPEIRINYAWLLNRGESTKLSTLYDRKLLDDDEASVLVDSYRREWLKHEKAILSNMSKLLGLTFYRDVIDVHIAQLFVPKSEPLIISCMDDPDTFVDTLTHELIHVLLTDNSIIQLAGKDRDYELLDRWAKMFGNEHSFTTLVHIPVHATHALIMRNYFKDDSRVDRDKGILRKFNSSDYLASWEYVEVNGAEKIVSDMKKDYEKINSTAGGKK